LEFSSELRAKVLKVMMRIVNKSWRTFKSELVCLFVRAGSDATVKHPFIPRHVSEDFVKLHDTNEAKERSERFKKIHERN
jgi:hypothetical protein